METGNNFSSRTGKSYWTERRIVRESASIQMQRIQHWINEIPCDSKATSENINICTISEQENQCSSLTTPVDIHLPWPMQSENSVLSNGGNIVEENDNFSEASYSSWYSHGVSDERSSDENCVNDQNETGQYDLRSKLAEWAVDFNINHVAIHSLLKILRTHFPNLPTDPRTLLTTQTCYNITELASGKYHHFGVAKSICDTILSTCMAAYNKPSVINITINIDGLPLFKSSRIQFWPILGKIVELDKTDPFIIGLYCGEQKPSDVHEYLQEFVEEMKSIERHGVVIHADFHVRVQIACFICDAPARAYVKQIKPHNSYHGCEKCCQHGVWKGRVTFPEVNATLRTDKSFNEMKDPLHHTNVDVPSPLKSLSVGLVTQFVLDPMHLVYLGVMKKLLWLWTKAPRNFNSRVGLDRVSSISQKLTLFHEFIPSEFPRKCRPLIDVERWKATEYRQFLLYSGMVILKSNLPQAFYKHFMLLFVSIYCLSSPVYCISHCTFANELLLEFVKNFGSLYSRETLVYNVHNLIHLAAEVKRFGPLDTISAFPFESYLGRLKKLLRKPNSAIAQVIRRLSEYSVVRRNMKSSESSLLILQNRHYSGPLPFKYRKYSQFAGVQFEKFHFSTKNSDNCIRVGHRIGLIRNILSLELGENENGESTLILYEPFSGTSDFFEFPLPSSGLGINRISNLTGVLKTATLRDIDCKYVRFPYDRHHVVIPLLHQFI